VALWLASSARRPRELLTKRQQERDITTRAFQSAITAEGPLRVLEAGCGQKWTVKVPGATLRLTGVDYDADALRIRKEEQQDLDEIILGDLRTVELPAEAFDVAYCAFVLEHVEGAEAVMDRLLATVRKGGLIVVLMPDGQSVVGWAAKNFPLKAAVFYKRHIEGFKDAGQPGHAPYPTVYDPVVSLGGMRRYAEKHHLTITEEYSIDYVLHNFGRFKKLAALAMTLARILSGNRLSSSHNNLGFVLRKPSDQPPIVPC